VFHNTGKFVKNTFLFVHLRSETLLRQEFSHCSQRLTEVTRSELGAKRVRCFQSILCVVNKVADSENSLNKIKEYLCPQRRKKKPKLWHTLKRR
jgi:hypothetical protein